MGDWNPGGCGGYYSYGRACIGGAVRGRVGRMELLVAAIAAFALGAVLAWLAAARSFEGRLHESAVRMEERERAFAEQKALIESSERKLADTFKSLAADALEAANRSFLTLADQKLGAAVAPVSESLGKLDREIRAIEGARREAYGALGEQIGALLVAQKELRGEAMNLTRALRAPSVRGRWGEMQLKRVVEMAGMLERCDFFQQANAVNDDGRLRPDLRVQLPGGKNIIVDAKVPLQAYLEALDAPSEEARQERLRQHAQQVRAHMAALSAKSYWDQFQPTPEFVILFLPGEPFFSAALEQDPSLIEQGVTQRVILATPTTLISLLRAVAYGWRQEQLAENAQRISEMARELADRFATMIEHLRRVGGSLRSSVAAFNDAVGSFESRVMPWARRFRELGVAGKKEPGELERIDLNPREPSAFESPAELPASK
ncbi:MAG TPA: DNA recombination protein RmuC [Candidatus Binataceae bacterium]|nr:DNA recombination protein RmuC [Candidatus Binataceae bacterium]